MALRRFRLPVLYLTVFLLICFGLYLVITRVFALREISVVAGNIQVTIDQKKFPKTLLFFPSDKLREEILLTNPILADIRFEKKYPHTLVIVPTLRSAVAIVITPTRRVFIDERGIVLSDADSTPRGLPQIVAPITGLRIGQLVSDTSLKSILAFLLGTASYLPMETLVVSDSGVITAHTGNLDILFTQDEDVSLVLATLQTSLTGFRIKGTLPKVIDLRFDKPVVTF